MSQPTAGRIDLAKLSPSGLTVSGEMPLERFSRLGGAILGATRPVAYHLTLRRDPRGFVLATGAVQATVRLTCQRCLQDMAWPIDALVAVGIVESEGLLERLPDTLEPHLASAGVVTVADLVEDELLLALPLVAMHPAPGECPAAAAEFGPGPVETVCDDENPFAVLARLKTKH
jgi:uncharacterized protein